MKADSKKRLFLLLLLMFMIKLSMLFMFIPMIFFFVCLLKDFVDLFVTCNLFLKLGSFFGNWNWKCFVQLELPLEKILNLPYYWRAIRRSGFPHLAQPWYLLPSTSLLTAVWLIYTAIFLFFSCFGRDGGLLLRDSSSSARFIILHCLQTRYNLI